MSLKQIECPSCHQRLAYDPSNANRPFCSERCKLIDLGEWANESYKIPAKSTDDEEFK